MSSRSANSTQSVSLFPFLDVLVCTMGCLILLMLGIIHQGEKQVSNGEIALPGKSPPAPVIVKPLPVVPLVAAAPPVEPKPEVQAVPRENEPDFLSAIPSQVSTPGTAHDPELAAEQERLKQQSLDKVAAAESEKEQKLRAAELARAQAAAAQKKLHQVQTELRLSQEQLAALEAQKAELQKSGTGTKTEQEKLVYQIAQAQRSLELLKRRQATVPNEFAFVPYDGASGTTRRPLYVECTDNGFHILPEDVWIRPTDLEGCAERTNPLLVGMSTLRDYWRSKKQGKDEPEPYLLLIVRPNGTVAYYVARKLLSNFQGPFGYELVDQGTKLSFGDADPAAKSALKRSLDQAYALRDERLKDLAGDLSSGGRHRGNRPLSSSDPETIRAMLRERKTRNLNLRRESNSVDDISRKSLEPDGDDFLPTHKKLPSSKRDSAEGSRNQDTGDDLPAEDGASIANARTKKRGDGATSRSLGKMATGTNSGRLDSRVALTGESRGRGHNDGVSPRPASISGREDDELPTQESPSTPQIDALGNPIRQTTGVQGSGGLPAGIPKPLIRLDGQTEVAGGSDLSGTEHPKNANGGKSGKRRASDEDPAGPASGRDLPLDAAEPELIPQEGTPSDQTSHRETITKGSRSSRSRHGGNEKPSTAQGQRTGDSQTSDSTGGLPRLDSLTNTSPPDGIPSLDESASTDHAGTPGSSKADADGNESDHPDQKGSRGRNSPQRRAGGAALSPDDTIGHSTPYSGEDPQTFSGMAGGSAGSPATGNSPPGGVNLTLNPPGHGESSRHGGREGKSWTFAGGRRGIGLQKKVVIHALADRLLIGPENLAVPAGRGETQKELLQQVVGGINITAQEWGAPPANFHWVPAVQFKVYPGGNQHYERIQGVLREHGINSTVDYALDGAPQDRQRGGRR